MTLESTSAGDQSHRISTNAEEIKAMLAAMHQLNATTQLLLALLDTPGTAPRAKEETSKEDLRDIIRGETGEIRAQLIEVTSELEQLRFNAGRKSKIPDTFRLPSKKRGEKCPHTGMTRSSLERLIRAKLIRTETISTIENSKKPIVLIVGSSWESYLARKKATTPRR